MPIPIAISNFVNSAALLYQPPPAQFTSFSGVSPTSMYPYIVVAILIDALIVALWYMAGAVLANNGIKAGARNEAWQVLGTVVIAGIIIGSLLAFGSIYQNAVVGVAGGNPTLLSPTTMYNQCLLLGYLPQAGGQPAALASSPSGFDMVPDLIGTEFLSQPQTINTAPAANPSLCDIIYEVRYNEIGDGTVLVDYPLAASGVVSANLTDQTAQELNDAFVLDAYLSFLKALNPTLAVCIGVQPSCASFPFFGAPPFPGVSYITYTKFDFAPLAGLDLIIKSLTTISSLLYAALAIFIAQLLFTNIFIYLWPWLLFFGIVLRGVFFTRKIGGLLIAVALGAILIYPAIFGMEYLASNNTSIYPTSLTPLTFCGSSQYQYTPNFYRLPSISGIAQDCDCWPGAGIVGTETLDILAINEPYFWGYDVITGGISSAISSIYGSSGANIGTFLFSLVGGSTSGTTFQNSLSATGVQSCQFGSYQGTPASSVTSYGAGLGSYNYGEGMVFGITQVYGIVGVSAYFIPVINIIITLAAILGLSGLLGGDTTLAGLSRLI